jgi:CRP-like cAMP-binding protein
VLDAGHFFGEGCFASQLQRMATASAMSPSTVIVVDKQDMARHLHAQPAFADRFLSHMLTRNIRIEEDLIDQLCPKPATPESVVHDDAQERAVTAYQPFGGRRLDVGAGGSPNSQTA